MRNKTLQVWLYQEMVRTLSQDLGGRFEFEDAQVSSHALSLSLPLSQKRYDHWAVRAFLTVSSPKGMAFAT